MAEKPTELHLRSFDVNEKLISSIDNGIVILDENLYILYFNDWLEIRAGLKEKDLLNKRFCDVFTNVNQKTLQRKIKTALKMGTPTFYSAKTSKYLIPIKINQLSVTDFKHMRQDVSVIPFDKEKKLVALIITDQTNMTNALGLLEANILKIEDLNKQLVKERETIDEKVLLIKFNLDNVITNVSLAFSNLTQCLKEDLIDNDYFKRYKLSLSEELKTNIKNHIREKKVFNFENKILTKKGKEILLVNSLAPEYDSRAKHIGFILFMEDVTSSKKLIKQQEKLLATSRSAAMGEMISMIAHQWRQPLSVVNTIIATLRVKHELNVLNKEAMDSAFEKIEETVKYLSTTIDDFRNYFKPNKIIKDVSISEVVDKSTAFLLGEMKLLDINYEERIEEDLNLQTYQNELVQCVINVLKNSIDAFEENSIENQSISLIAKKESAHLSLLITDNAGGIDKEVIKKVFEPYFSTKAKNGTGLGLYMTKTIIEEHLNGKVTITSHDRITKVLIELPFNVKTKEKNESNLSKLLER